MQEQYTHLHKRHLVLELFHTEVNEYKRDWIQISKKNPDCKSSCKVLAKFTDGHEEEVYFCERQPHWWYVHPKGKNPVIVEDIVEWCN